jgi:hypothetical protein
MVYEVWMECEDGRKRRKREAQMKGQTLPPLKEFP